MKYSETETTEIKSFSETESTEINYCSETEGTGIFFKPTFIILLLLMSTVGFSKQVHIFSTNLNSDVKGVLVDKGISYLIKGHIQDNILNAIIINDFDEDIKAVDEGTGDEEEDTDNPINKSINNNLSIILSCDSKSEGIIENSKGKVIDLFKGRVHLNGKAINCNNRNIELNHF